MNTHDQLWRQSLRDTVIVIHVRPWMEAVAAVCGFLMITGALELLA